jgi:dual-specificity kinase
MRYPDFGNPTATASSSLSGGAFLQRRADGKLMLYGKYVFFRELGKGTFSKVAEAVDVPNERRVALKIFRACQRYREACEDELRVLDRLRGEATALFVNEGRDYRSSFLAHVGSEGRFYTSSAASKSSSKVRLEDQHCAIVFPLAGPSLLHIMQRQDEGRGLPIEVVRSVAMQVLTCLELCHRTGIAHTDVKPENVLFLSRDLVGPKGRELPVHSAVSVIDFGNAVDFQQRATRKRNERRGGRGSAEEDGDESTTSKRIIQTRHYRAPEVILESGWSFSADLWSVGCLLPELLTGDCLFMVHRDDEHLAMMQRVIGRMTDRDLAVFASGSRFREFVSSSTRKLRWPGPDVLAKDIEFVEQVAGLREQCRGRQHPLLLDLAEKLLMYDPRKRLTAAEALRHPFFVS